MTEPNKSEADGRVYLHDLLHALQTGVGMRPKPAGGKDESEMVPVPVELQLSGYAGTRDEPVAGSMLIGFTRFQIFPGRPGHPARLVLFAEVPDTHRVVNLADSDVLPLAQEVEPGEDGEQIGSEEPNALPPELRHLDPAVYSVNTDRPAGYSTQRERVPNEADLKTGG